MNIDLSQLNKVYVIGIKGSGMIAVVEILNSRGIYISGSDTDEKFFTDEILKRLDIPYHEKFDERNIPSDADLIIYSTAYNENNNVEYRSAKERDLPMVSYPEILAGLFNAKFGIAVCGTHGKTTTSAMLASALRNCRVEPLAVIGSKVIDWNGNALTGEGQYFVAEADEYQNKLSLYDPQAAIFTSCDFDHPDYFSTFEDYKNVFREFVSKIPKTGFLVVWGDSVDTLDVAEGAKCRVFSYGFNEENDVKIEMSDTHAPADPDQVKDRKTQRFHVYHGKQDLGEYEIKLFGRHNVLNAAAVITTCYILNLSFERVKEALRNFKGTARRFEFIGERNGAVLIDDYGHHPEEIKATLRAARELYPEKNIWAVFHPHTYTRTKTLLHEFAQSFDDADRVVVLDIYGSAREEQGGVHSTELVELINKYNRGKSEYIPTVKETVEFLKDKIGPEDVVLAIGAGNVWEVVSRLKK